MREREREPREAGRCLLLRETSLGRMHPPSVLDSTWLLVLSTSCEVVFFIILNKL